MEKKKCSRFCPSIKAEAQDVTTVEVGTIAHDFSVSLSHDVCFTDLANCTKRTMLGTDHMHITTGCIKYEPDK